MTPSNSEPLELLSAPPFGVAAPDKRRLLTARLEALTAHHREHCEPYARALAIMHPHARPATRLEDVPFLPVTVFKTHALRSIPESEVFKVLTSSGTTGQVPSRIFLDRETATRQTRALAHIMTHVLGPQRLPMILVDTKSVFQNRQSFSARGAGLLGMANFGRDHFYALDEQMQLDEPGLSAFLEKYSGKPVLIFGFTYMVWLYFLEAARRMKADLSAATLIHSGGWKKLIEQAVDNDRFKASLREATGLARVYNFYGMVEQVGGVYLECDAGVLHAPSFSDVIARDVRTLEPAPFGHEGVLQVLSALPTSYPGHSLLTEDLGTVLGEDDCPCGRMGKYFSVRGRVPRSEIRGCSDTHAADAAAHDQLPARGAA
ncbi:MAG: acyl-protein synthetase, LuxE [Myxococcaceae bacterium]|nr:acyl-protein synthetase, LuxE [Myxococcaceae bacterium]